MKTTSDEVLIRIRVQGPPAGVRFQVQHGKNSLMPEARRSNSSIDFEFPLRVGTQADGTPNFLGPFAQGPPKTRFVYVNSGTLAGDAVSCWTRRAKVPLGGITWALIREAQGSGTVIEAEIAGVARDGGPVCASVPLRRTWRVASAQPD